MNNYNGIKLNFIAFQKRDNYMSLSDLVKDLKTECLIKILKTLTQFKNQMIVIKELEIRNELDEDYFYELLESCNGK